MAAQYSIENDYYILYSEEGKKTTASLAVRSGANQKAIKKMLQTIGKENGKKLTPTFQENGISIQINTLDENIVRKIVSDITLQFRQAGYVQSCMLKKSEENLSLYQMGATMLVANDVALVESVNAMNQANEQEINPLAGLFGGILGILVGMIAWIILAYLGWFSGWISFLMVVLGVKGFEKFGKGITKGWGIVIVVISVFAIIFAQFFSIGLSTYLAIQEAWGVSPAISDVIKLFPRAFADPESRSAILQSLFVGLLIGGFGMISSIKGIPTKEERSEVIQYRRIA